MLSVTSRSYWETSDVRNSACRRSSSRMSARECGALSHVMHSPQRSSTSTTSDPFASQRSGCRKLDPQRGHMVIAATPAKLRGAPDGRPRAVSRRETATLIASVAGGRRAGKTAPLMPLRTRCLALALVLLGAVTPSASADFVPLASPGAEIVGFAASGADL